MYCCINVSKTHNVIHHNDVMCLTCVLLNTLPDVKYRLYISPVLPACIVYALTSNIHAQLLLALSFALSIPCMHLEPTPPPPEPKKPDIDWSKFKSGAINFSEEEENKKKQEKEERKRKRAEEKERKKREAEEERERKRLEEERLKEEERLRLEAEKAAGSVTSPPHLFFPTIACRFVPLVPACGLKTQCPCCYTRRWYHFGEFLPLLVV